MTDDRPWWRQPHGQPPGLKDQLWKLNLSVAILCVIGTAAFALDSVGHVSLGTFNVVTMVAIGIRSAFMAGRQHERARWETSTTSSL